MHTKETKVIETKVEWQCCSIVRLTQCAPFVTECLPISKGESLCVLFLREGEALGSFRLGGRNACRDSLIIKQVRYLENAHPAFTVFANTAAPLSPQNVEDSLLICCGTILFIIVPGMFSILTV